MVADESVTRKLIRKDDLWHNFEKFNYIKLILNDIIKNRNDTNEFGKKYSIITTKPKIWFTNIILGV